jgi:hypothetical protein
MKIGDIVFLTESATVLLKAKDGEEFVILDIEYYSNNPYPILITSNEFESRDYMVSEDDIYL